jgi:hypothetical protein
MAIMIIEPEDMRLEQQQPDNDGKYPDKRKRTPYLKTTSCS